MSASACAFAPYQGRRLEKYAQGKLGWGEINMREKNIFLRERAIVSKICDTLWCEASLQIWCEAFVLWWEAFAATKSKGSCGDERARLCVCVFLHIIKGDGLKNMHRENEGGEKY